MKELWFLSSFLLIAGLAFTIADVPPPDSEDICRYFSNNTQIRDPESCNKYITCIDFVSHYKECTGSTPWFDKDKPGCVKTLPTQSSCYTSCGADSVGKFISDPKSCRSYYYCNSESSLTPGKCPDYTHFNETEQACIYKWESECAVEKFQFCAIIRNGVNFRDEKFCHKYYTCNNKGVMVSKTCPKKYYDPSLGVCVEKSAINCQEHPVPDGACGTVRRPKRKYFAEDEATCAGYFYCGATEDGGPDRNPIWGQCPEDHIFNEKQQRCVDPLDMKCSWDRCHGRTIPFVASGTKGCRHYLRCRDGITEEELSCGNLFFNERIGACTTEIVSEVACS